MRRAALALLAVLLLPIAAEAWVKSGGAWKLTAWQSPRLAG